MKTREELNATTIPMLNNAQEMYLKAYRDGDSDLMRKWKNEFRLLALEVKMSGFKLSKKKDWSTGAFRVIWRLRGESRKCWASEGKWIEFKPIHNFKGDCRNQCTTRCIYHILDELIDYDSIRFEQERNAKEYCRQHSTRRIKWNYEQAWGKVLTDRGFVKVELRRKIRRDRLAQLTKSLETKICTHSSHHLASIYRGDVYDSWDSRRCFVDTIYVKKEFFEPFHQLIG